MKDKQQPITEIEMSARLIIDGFKDLKQAKVFADWYSGQGEQSADYWFEEWYGDGAPCVAVEKSYEETEDTLTIYLREQK